MSRNTIRPKSAEEEKNEELEQIAEQAASEAVQESYEERDVPAPRRRNFRKALRNVMDGSFLLREGLQKHWRLILFCFILGILLISNNYMAESNAREISKIKKELKELRFKQISTRSECMGLSRQSYIALVLDSVGLKESVVPPVKIIMEDAR